MPSEDQARADTPKGGKEDDSGSGGVDDFSDKDIPTPAPASVSALSQQLEPRIQPLGIFMQFVRNEEASLIMTRKLPSATFEDFIVTDPNNNNVVVFRCRGHAKSLHQKMTILDDKDEPVLNVSQRLNTLARHFSIRAGNSMTESPEVAQITSHIMSIGVKLDVTFENAMDGERITLAVRGDKLHRNAIITLGGINIANVHRGLVNIDPYKVQIAAGVDVALIVAIVACMEQHHPFLP